MSPRSHRRWSAPASVALAVAALVTACGSEAPSAQVAVGAPAPSSSTGPVASPSAGSAASTVDGLTAAELREAVEAPDPGGKARASGPVAQPVRLASGTTVWRIRVPGRFPVRSARVVVSVGGRRIGEGVPGSRLQGLVAVTRDPSAIVSGAPVTYRWSGGPAVDAGRLAVVR